MNKTKILFVCVENSARSQMAEAFLNKYGSEKYFAESAGLEPGTLNPLVIEVMKEEGIDISNNKTKSAFDFLKQGKFFSYVIKLCNKESLERCPIFPGVRQEIEWSFNDPAKFEGSYEERLYATRIIRDQIKNKIIEWIKEFSD